MREARSLRASKADSIPEIFFALIKRLLKVAEERHEEWKKPIPNDAVTRGSGNVFADIGLPNADERLAKARIAHEISAIIHRLNLNQSQAVKQLGVDQPKISALLRGNLAGFSMERLFHFLNKLGQDVSIKIAPANDQEAGVHVQLTGTYS